MSVDELLDAETRQGATREIPTTAPCCPHCPCGLVDPDERDR